MSLLSFFKWTPPHYILEDSNNDFRYVRLCDLDILRKKMVELFANSGDPDQMLHSAASDLGLHCFPITLLGVSRLQWVKIICTEISIIVFQK